MASPHSLTRRSGVAKTTAPKAKTPELPRWELRACKNVDPEVFWLDADSEADLPNVTAYMTCMRCEILVSCLDWAMQHEKFGVWGGTTPRQRQKLARGIERVSCPGCFGTSILEEPGAEVCLGCGLSWKI